LFTTFENSRKKLKVNLKKKNDREKKEAEMNLRGRVRMVGRRATGRAHTLRAIDHINGVVGIVVAPSLSPRAEVGGEKMCISR